MKPSVQYLYRDCPTNFMPTGWSGLEMFSWVNDPWWTIEYPISLCPRKKRTGVLYQDEYILFLEAHRGQGTSMALASTALAYLVSQTRKRGTPLQVVSNLNLANVPTVYPYCLKTDGVRALFRPSGIGSVHGTTPTSPPSSDSVSRVGAGHNRSGPDPRS